MQSAFPDKSGEIIHFPFVLVPTHKPDELHANIRSSVARKLPIVAGVGPANDLELCVVGGGPSLQDTLPEIVKFVEEQRGYVAAVNGTLKWLLDHDIVPTMCGVCDPSPHMVDIVHADTRVTYFLASTVHPTVYDKLLDAGCRIFRWNISSIPNGLRVLDQVEPDWFMVGGGSTMGLRWLTLGYALGFRTFHLHGFDSSFREKSSHAYADHQDKKEWINLGGYQTRPNFLGQVTDFLGALNRFMESDADAISLKVYGTGLLQDQFAKWKEANPGCHEGPPKVKRPEITDGFMWPVRLQEAKYAILQDVKHMDRFLAYVPRTNIALQAGGNVGVYPAHLARRFQHVHTFEPDPESYRCLVENIGMGKGNINAVNAALGEADSQLSTGNAVQTRTIDGLDLHALDLLWLDVEGGELKALQGAEKTIEKFRPAVIIDDRGHAGDWLLSHGYAATMKIGNDKLFMPAPELLPLREDEFSWA